MVLFPAEGKSTETHLKAVFACTQEWFAVLGSSTPSILAALNKLQTRAEQSSLSSLPPSLCTDLILPVIRCTWTEVKDTWTSPHLCKHLATNTDCKGRKGPNPNTKGPGQAAQFYLLEAAEMQQVVVTRGLQGEGRGGNVPAAEEGRRPTVGKSSRRALQQCRWKYGVI